MKKRDFEQGIDARGDQAVFIESRHINGWELDETSKKYIQITFEDVFFFRVIKDGIQQSGHGYIDVTEGRIIQWG